MKHLLLLCLSALAVSAFGDVGYPPQDSQISAVLLNYEDHSNGIGYHLAFERDLAIVDVLARDEAAPMIALILDLCEAEPSRIETVSLPAHHPSGYLRHSWIHPSKLKRPLHHAPTETIATSPSPRRLSSRAA